MDMDRWIQYGEALQDFFISNATEQSEATLENEVGTLKRLFAEQSVSLDMDCVPDFLVGSVPAIFASGIYVRMCNELGLKHVTNATCLNVLFEHNVFRVFCPFPGSPTNVEQFPMTMKPNSTSSVSVDLDAYVRFT